MRPPRRCHQGGGTGRQSRHPCRAGGGARAWNQGQCRRNTQMSMTDVSGLSQLGQNVEAPQSPETAVLEKVPNGNQGTDYLVRFTAPEFTSLCPMTGQPDFAHIGINYIPEA